MRLNIVAQLTITSKKLFIIVTDVEFDKLVDIKKLRDLTYHLSMPVSSVEWVNILNDSFPGVVLQYKNEDELRMLQSTFKDTAIAE